ncbi:MAG: ParB/RepB/Spo0J family partition protein [Clostridia bacterium]|nr:ParB/RepB/Spo0J family partition protein [Clostridia bacterium]
MNVNFNGYMQNMCIEHLNIDPIPNNPFQLHDDDTMEMLTESIRKFGVLDPIMVREIDKARNHYQMISGRRRLEVCHRLGINQIPVRVVTVSEDEAIIAMVEANLCQRSDLLPSEKTAAYKMRLDAMKRQGYRSDLDIDGTSAQVGQKLGGTSIQQLADESPDSRTQIQRYIRLAELAPELQKMVDEKRIALTPAVELSYLPQDAQRDLITTIESEDATPSLHQAQQMRKLAESGNLDMDRIFSIMTEPKPNQKETIKVPVEFVRTFRPKASIQELQKFIQDACAHYAKYLRNRDKGAR